MLWVARIVESCADLSAVVEFGQDVQTCSLGWSNVFVETVQRSRVLSGRRVEPDQSISCQNAIREMSEVVVAIPVDDCLILDSRLQVAECDGRRSTLYTVTINPQVNEESCERSAVLNVMTGHRDAV